jgi:peptidoglycan/LPS O-acetylase OafA/YrhL
MIGRSKHISNIILLLSGYTLIRLVTTDGLPSTIINRFFNSWEDCVFYSLTFIIPLPALVLLWLQKRSGYLLVLVSSLYSLVKSCLLFFIVVKAVGNASLTDLVFLLIPCGIYGGIVYFLLKKSVVREVFF